MSLILQEIDFRKQGWTPTTSETEANNDGFGLGNGVLATPLEKLSSVSLEGTGAFDVLMRATKLHLLEEFDAQRITGKEYATVYLGALTAVLQTAAQFLLNEQQVAKINAEIGLTRQKIVTELALTDDNVPQGLGFNYVPSDIYETREVETIAYPVDYASTYTSPYTY